MRFMGRLGLATVFIAILSVGTAASAATLDAFYGRWVGKGITENLGKETGINFADRDLDVTVKPAEQGFTIIWKTARTIRKKGVDDVRLWSVAVPFAETDRAGIYRMSGSSDPLTGSPYMWARIEGRKLVVNSITISEKGVLEQQRYVRTLLSDDEMQLRFTRSVDGSVVRSVLAHLVRE